MFSLFLACATSHAHHGFAALYDVNDQVRIEGIIQSLSYRNPHSEIRVLVTDESGSETVWSCETQASSLLSRKGITRDRFPVGEPIVITGARSRRDAKHCEIGSVWLPDGTTVTMRSVEGRADISVNPVTTDSVDIRESIFGNWVRDSFDGAPVRAGFLAVINAAGRAANSQYDGTRDDPTLRCSPVNPVRAMFAPGTPTEIRREGNRVVIRHEFMDTTRIVHLDATAIDSDDQTPDIMGVSRGRIDNGALVVETRNFAPGVLLTHVGDSGVLHSGRMQLTESLRVDPATGQLLYRWEARDAEYFSDTIGGELGLSPTSLTIGRFNCEPQLRGEPAERH